MERAILSYEKGDNSKMKDYVMRLKDGRALAYTIYGDPAGVPLFLLHGTPGSRLWFLDDDTIAKELGIRLIATDRPGYGRSDSKVNRTLKDYTRDIQELADHLEIRSFSVLGVSGGGAYAVEKESCLTQMIRQCSLVSTATPFQAGKSSTSMSKENSMAFFPSNHFPWLIKLANKSQKRLLDHRPMKYKETLKKGGRHLSPWDNNMLLNENVLDTGISHLKEAYHQGVDEVIEESRLLTKAWGIELEDVTVPITIWHGEEDTLSLVSEVEEMEKRFQHIKAHYVKRGGHFLTESDEIWTSILTEYRASIQELPNK